MAFQSAETLNRCLKCGQTGHYSTFCPVVTNQPTHIPVSVRPAHQQAPRTNASDRPPFQTPGPSPAARSGERVPKCYKCGQEGHFANSCTVPRSEWQKNPILSTPGNFQLEGGAGGRTPGTLRGPGQISRGTCLKCGQQGHWSRDCTVPRSEWVQNGGATGGESSPYPSQNQPIPINGVIKPTGPKKIGRKRPLDVDDLKEDHALPLIFNSFADDFRRGFRGKGHEVSDLRRLLEMYAAWQRQIAPRHEFHEFLDNMERLGTKKALRVELTKLREEPFNELNALESELDVLPMADLGMSNEELAAHTREGTCVQGHALGDGGDRPPPPRFDAADNGGFPDDDELLDLMGQDLDTEMDVVPEELLNASWSRPAANPGPQEANPGARGAHPAPNEETATRHAVVAEENPMDDDERRKELLALLRSEDNTQASQEDYTPNRPVAESHGPPHPESHGAPGADDVPAFLDDDARREALLALLRAEDNTQASQEDYAPTRPVAESHGAPHPQSHGAPVADDVPAFIDDDARRKALLALLNSEDNTQASQEDYDPTHPVPESHGPPLPESHGPPLPESHGAPVADDVPAFLDDDARRKALLALLHSEDNTQASQEDYAPTRPVPESNGAPVAAEVPASLDDEARRKELLALLNSEDNTQASQEDSAPTRPVAESHGAPLPESHGAHVADEGPAFLDDDARRKELLALLRSEDNTQASQEDYAPTRPVAESHGPPLPESHGTPLPESHGAHVAAATPAFLDDDARREALLALLQSEDNTQASQEDYAPTRPVSESHGPPGGGDVQALLDDERS